MSPTAIVSTVKAFKDAAVSTKLLANNNGGVGSLTEDELTMRKYMQGRDYNESDWGRMMFGMRAFEELKVVV